MRMISAVARIVNVPGATERVTMTPQGLPPQPPEWFIDLSFSGYQPFYERYTPNSEGFRSNWKSFEHFKSVQAAPTTEGMPIIAGSPGPPPNHSAGTGLHDAVGYDQWFTVGTVRPFGDYGRLDDGLPTFESTQTDGSFIPPPEGLSLLTQRALSSMLPIIKAELSLPNFLLELKDFKRPVSKVVSVFRSRSFTAALAKAGLTKKSLTFKELLKGGAGHYLNLKFNILPLISDIGKIRLALTRTERRLADFITREGRPQTKHFSWVWSEYPDVNNDELIQGSPGYQTSLGYCECGAERKVTYDPSVFHAEIQYNYNYTGYQRENARWLTYLDAFGINYNPAIIWNAIPWTFVIDWVAGIGPFLDSMKTTNMEPQINIRRYLWSVKRRRVIVVTKATYMSGARSLIMKKQMPLVTQTAYRRSVGLPSVSSFTTSGLNSEEISLGAALVIARKRR